MYAAQGKPNNKEDQPLEQEAILLDSNSALSLHLEQVKNLLDELAMGKELEEDDPK